ncbi:hypothetical protein, partial [Ensifer sp. B1-9]|uniref:hypothetical protein n=1 Tax=Ensifer sp. B1-9 TaxID=3141455 RepID=UPI003D200EA4
PKSASANQGNSRAKVVVASSAAALVSDRAYRPHTSNTSTDIFTTSIEFLQQIENKDEFLFTGMNSRFSPVRAGENPSVWAD